MVVQTPAIQLVGLEFLPEKTFVISTWEFQCKAREQAVGEMSERTSEALEIMW